MQTRSDVLKKFSTWQQQIDNERQHKWQVETAIALLNKQVTPIGDSDNEKIDYTEIIVNLEKKITVLSKQEKSDQLNTWHKEAISLKQALHQHIENLNKVISQASEYAHHIRMHQDSKTLLAMVRKEIAVLSIEEKVKSIAILSEKISLKIILEIYQEIKFIIEKMLVRDLKKNTSFNEICKEVDLDIVDSFRRFTKEQAAITSDNVLQEMQRILNKFKQALQLNDNNNEHKRLYDYLKTEIYLLCAIETFDFSDRLQMLPKVSAMSIGSALIGKNDLASLGLKFKDKMTTQEIVNSFIALTEGANHIYTEGDATLKLFEELNYWLAGIYQRGCNKIPAHLKNDAVIRPEARIYIGDEDDRKLFISAKKKIATIAISENHGKHSQAIITRIEQLKASLKEKKVSNTNELVASPIIKTSQFFQALPQQKSLLQSADFLKSMQDKEVIARYNYFLSMLNTGCELNDLQKHTLNGYKPQFVTLATKYKNTWFSLKFYGPVFLPTVHFTKRSHADTLDSVMTQLDESQDPKTIIQIFYNLSNKLQSADSKEAWSAVKAFLESLFTALIDSANYADYAEKLTMGSTK